MANKLGNWETAIREVNQYFATNSSAQLAFGQKARADNMLSAGQEISHTPLTQSEIDSFQERVDNHLAYMQKRGEIEKLAERSFSEIYYMRADKRSLEEQMLVQEAMAALSPEQFSKATAGNVKVSEVMQDIEHSKLSKVVADMAEIAEDRSKMQNTKQEAEPLKAGFWDNMGNILGKITKPLLEANIAESEVNSGESIKPTATPAKKTDQSHQL